MEDYVKRLIDEEEKLFEKMDKLSKFLNTDIFKKLEKGKQQLLQRQYEIMVQYDEILIERISLEIKENTN